MMKRKLLFFTMLCCMALSANACGTDGTHQQTAENEITCGGDENENNTEESGEGLFDLTQGENGKPPVITLSSGYTMPVLGLGTYSLHGDECIKATVAATSGWNKTSTLSFLNMPILSYAGEIRSAVLLVHGEKAHSRYFSEDPYKKLTGDNKELLIIPGANHTDLYDNFDKIPFDKIEAFYREYLK